MTAGAMIRAARKAKGLTQRDLAKRVGIDFTYVSKIETGTTDLPASERTYRAIAGVLDLDADKLLAASDRYAKIRASDLDRLLTIIATLLDGVNQPAGWIDRTAVYTADVNDLSAWWLAYHERSDSR